MKVEIYVIAYNEEVMLPFFIKHYQNNFPGCKIVVYDNRSTDDTRKIAHYHGCEIRDLFTHDKMDDFTHMLIKNNVWKESNTDWVFCLDADEICNLNKDDLKEIDEQGCNLVTFKGYEMFGDTYKPEKCYTGVESVGYSKPVLFKKSDFKEINYSAGAHSCDPIMQDNVVLSNNYQNFNLFHFKWWNWHYGLDRAKLLAARQSEENVRTQRSIHFAFPEEVHKDYYLKGMDNKEKVR